MPWQALNRCTCCHGCVFLNGAICRIHEKRRLCNGSCADRALDQPSPLAVLTDEEQARCARLATHPAARFPLLTLDEMRHLLWYNEYFGEREHQHPERPSPRLDAQERQAIKRFIHPDAA